MSDCGIYVITHAGSGMVYVGSSIRLRYRLDEHRRKLVRGTHENARLQNAFTKYGVDAFTCEIVELVADREALLTREQHWLDSLKAANRRHGFNIYPVAGSSAKAKHTPESRQKMREAQLRRAPASAETRAKLSAALRGKPKSAEAVAKQRAAITGRVPSAEERAKVGAYFRGRPRPRDAVERTAAAHVGMKRSEEARAKMSAAAKARVARLGFIAGRPVRA